MLVRRRNTLPALGGSPDNPSSLAVGFVSVDLTMFYYADAASAAKNHELQTLCFA